MAAQPQSNLFKLMGFNAQGDLGPLTFYVSARKKLVWFDKAPPLTPPSDLQLHQRNKFRNAATLWNSLTQERREAWRRAEQLGHLGITGFNLFVSWAIKGDTPTIRTVERQTGLTLID